MVLDLSYSEVKAKEMTVVLAGRADHNNARGAAAVAHFDRESEAHGVCIEGGLHVRPPYLSGEQDRLDTKSVFVLMGHLLDSGNGKHVDLSDPSFAESLIMAMVSPKSGKVRILESSEGAVGHGLIDWPRSAWVCMATSDPAGRTVVTVIRMVAVGWEWWGGE